MIAWLTDTFAYTALLIALVLGLRRPVTRHFGPQVAYALWALPLLRFALPPIVLPASFAPVSMAVVPIRAAKVAAATVPVAEPSGLPWALIAFAAWAIGAVLFLGWRGWSYFRMRDALLAGSLPVGEAGKVRLIETPALAGPVAFGVIDKVVALPIGFMAHEDRAARDFAIAHELAHHRGGDLLANVLAQPLLALHWFNPLAWIGWRAMRRDQEAACDARVVACRSPAERAHYGRVIASFAAGPRLALAAPMACPMAGGLWGEKAIVHRLRSLSLSDVSPRRRWAGRALWAGAALALPLTASISYAVVPAPAAPAAPAVPEAPQAPAATAAPEASAAPPAPRERKYIRRIAVGPQRDGGVSPAPNAAPAGGPEDVASHPRFVREFVLRPTVPLTEEQRQKFAQQWAEQGRRWAELGKQFGQDWQKRAEQWTKEAQQRAYELQRQWKGGAPEAFTFAAPGGQPDCAGGGANSVVTDPARPGVRNFVLCPPDAQGTARRALERAKTNIANDESLPAEARDEAIRSLDQEIQRLDPAHDTGN